MPTGPIQLKNGFYIEVCNKGSKTGIKIHSATQQGMEASISMYSGYAYKAVTVLGEYIDGIPQRDLPSQLVAEKVEPITLSTTKDDSQVKGDVKLVIYNAELPGDIPK